MLRKTFIRFIFITATATTVLVVLSGIRYNSAQAAKRCCALDQKCNGASKPSEIFIWQTVSLPVLGFPE